MKKYTGKERVEAAFRREYADRVPYNLDFGPHYAKEMGMTPRTILAILIRPMK